ncbi:IS3 family transposase, partial [Williamsia muralis]
PPKSLKNNYTHSNKPVLHRPIEPAQYTSIAFSKELREAGITGSIGTVGDALMESAIGVYKTELIERDRSWSNRAEVERETAAYVHWYNSDRLHSSIGYCSPIEYESRYGEQVASEAEVA